MDLNDKDLDDLIKLAAAKKRPEANADALRRRIAGIGKNALTEDIETFLVATPLYPHPDVLRKVANLNQGAFEDLARSDFISYVIATLGVDYEKLIDAIRALRSFLLSRDQPRSTIAARDAASDVEGPGLEINRLLRRRVS